MNSCWVLEAKDRAGKYNEGKWFLFDRRSYETKAEAQARIDMWESAHPAFKFRPAKYASVGLSNLLLLKALLHLVRFLDSPTRVFEEGWGWHCPVCGEETADRHWRKKRDVKHEGDCLAGLIEEIQAHLRLYGHDAERKKVEK